MGTLFYGASRLPIKVEDRLLAHLKLVTTSKMRRNEGFLISWTEGVSLGRHSVWVNSAIELHYRFDGSRPPVIVERIVHEMAAHSMDARGIDLNDRRYEIPDA